MTNEKIYPQIEKQKVNINSVEVGKPMCIRGKLAFSRIARLVEGKELEASNENKRRFGIKETDVPHYTITLKDAYVDFKDKENPTIEELYAYNKIYTSKTDNKETFSMEVKCKNPENKKFKQPIIAALREDGKYDKLRLIDDELAKDLDVTVVINTYESKVKGNNNGLNLPYIIVNEPIRYFSKGGSAKLDKELAEKGIIFVTDRVINDEDDTNNTEHLGTMDEDDFDNLNEIDFEEDLDPFSSKKL